MITSWRRMASGLNSLRSRDPSYFTSPKEAGRTHFREDLRSIVGGALAGAFLVAALASMINFPQESSAIVVAAIIGGVAGKFLPA